MVKLSKNRKISLEKIDSEKSYSLDEASALVKEVTTTKFDSSVDLAIRLGVDPKKANEMVRGVVSLPHGTGKSLKLLALVTPDKEEEAKKKRVRFSAEEIKAEVSKAIEVGLRQRANSGTSQRTHYDEQQNMKQVSLELETLKEKNILKKYN